MTDKRTDKLISMNEEAPESSTVLFRSHSAGLVKEIWLISVKERPNFSLKLR